MKRLIYVILLLSLLCACAPAETPPEPSPPAEASDGGFKVHTDYTNYTPYSPPEAKYTRLKEEWIENLAPRKDYGTLYPFAGTPLYISYNEGYSHQSGALYGLFDANGRIVADPTYAEITRLSYYDYSTSESMACPFLLLTRSVFTGKVENEFGEYYEGSSVYAIASLDGSFVTECKYGYVRGFADGVLCAASYESQSFVLYDNYGNVLMTDKDIPFDDYWCGSISYDEGIISINASTSYDDCTYYYLDLDGNILHGPYAGLTPYSCGTAVVRFGGEEGEVIIDRAGKRTSPHNYSYLSSKGNGLYVLYDDDGSCSLIDAKGNTIFDAGTDTLFETPYGYCGWKYTDTSSFCYFFDKHGNLLLDSSETEWAEVYDTPLASHQTDSGVEVINVETGERLFIPGADYVGPIYTDALIGDVAKTVNCVIARDFESEQSIVLDFTPAKIMEHSVEFAQVFADELSGKEYVYIDGTLYDNEFNVIGSYPNIDRVYDGMIMYSDTTGFVYADMQGNIIFRYNYLMESGD
ncbi:MAG: WG repeat-containing protein [Oscillospiraceae bacterium]|nr:WG repeat-containing protein [Oscillospiraceae bacterium]